MAAVLPTAPTRTVSRLNQVADTLAALKTHQSPFVRDAVTAPEAELRAIAADLSGLLDLLQHMSRTESALGALAELLEARGGDRMSCESLSDLIEPLHGRLKVAAVTLDNFIS